MADIRIKELTELTELTDNDYFVVDNSASGGETKKYRATRVTEMIDAVADEIEEKITPSIDTALAVGSASGDIASFPDGSNLPMPKLQVGIEPVQDLHGYDAPWVGGGGKNKLPMTPQTGSNTINGIIWTVNDDGSIKVSGTATTRSLFYYLPVGSYDTLNGEYTVSIEGMTEGMNNGFQIGGNWRSAIPAFTTTYENATIQQFWVDVTQGATINTTIKPMIRLATETDPTFEPYSNICPISGWDECNVGVSPNRLVGANWKDGYFINASGQEQSNNLYKYTTTMISVKPSTTYYVQMNYQSTSDLVISVPYYNNNGGFISRDIVTTFNTRGIHGGQFTTPNNCYGIRVSLPYNSDGWNLQEGASIVADNTYTIDLDGTVYGGSLDVVSGELVVDRAFIKEGWEQYNSSNGYKAYRQATPTSKGMTQAVSKAMSNMISEYGSFSSSSMSRNIIQLPIQTSDLAYMALQEDLNANDVELSYLLATPITYQLTPTQVKSLLGQNNVWADCGEIIDCEYKRDATAIINSLIARIEALENQ